MDSTVIQEIANQLGMAVDQAGQFITEHLPEYAAMKVMQISAPITIAVAVVIVCAIGSIVSYAIVRDTDSLAFCCFFAPLVIVGAGLFIGLLVYLPDLIGWSQYPEAMLIDMALKAVG